MRESRHPEWDLMFAAGITRSKIAELCHGQRATVFAHFKTRIDRDPEILVTHNTSRALAAVDHMSSVQRAWVARLAAYLGEHDRWPLSGPGRGNERNLAAWLSTQRKLARRGELPQPLRTALDGLGEWETTPHTRAQSAHWHAQLHALAEFLAREGRWPSYEPTVKEPEHGLGVWLHMQRQKNNSGKLPVGQVELMDTDVAGWRGRGY